MQHKHKGHKSEENRKKWHSKVKKITELLTVMDKMQAPGGLPFVNAQDISACEDLLEAYFMQVTCPAFLSVCIKRWNNLPCATLLTQCCE